MDKLKFRDRFVTVTVTKADWYLGVSMRGRTRTKVER
jgi:hypothetical protein